jgi:putative membrane protein
MPLVLVTWSRALKEKFEAHKKIARITFPIWLYVSATGVLVYILISPYY